MINGWALLGQPYKFEDKINIYPPTVNDFVTNPQFSLYVSLLTTSQEMLQDQYDEQEKGEAPSAFEFLLLSASYDKTMKEAILQAFEFFTHEKAMLSLEKGLILFETVQTISKKKSLEELRYLDQNNFEAFQDAIRNSMGIEKPEVEPLSSNPEVAKMQKQARARERKKQELNRKRNKGISFETCLVAICCMGIGITPLNIGEISYAAVGYIINTYQAKEKYDMDIKSLLAGADAKKVKPEYWIKNF